MSEFWQGTVLGFVVGVVLMEMAWDMWWYGYSLRKNLPYNKE